MQTNILTFLALGGIHIGLYTCLCLVLVEIVSLHTMNWQEKNFKMVICALPSLGLYCSMIAAPNGLV